MPVNCRREPRTARSTRCSFTWKDAAGLSCFAEARFVNISASGAAVRIAVSVPPNTEVYIESPEVDLSGYAHVRHCTSDNGTFIVGLELTSDAKQSFARINGANDYYEFLQISPKAQTETIHRVYHFLAARYHPDNQETGDPDKFVLLNEAYRVLSTPEQRAQYDSKRREPEGARRSLFEDIDFLDGVEGEVNRRLALLSILYRTCRANVHNAQLSILDIEAQIGCPREYLDFAIWYLRAKKYITFGDNATLSLTALGVDYIEENHTKQPILHRLIGGRILPTDSSPESNGSSSQWRNKAELALTAAGAGDSNHNGHHG